MGGYGRAMSRYAVFEGRASRGEFWQFTALVMLFCFLGLMIDGASAQEFQREGGIVTGLIVLAHFLPMWAVTVRRLHDTNRTGWLVFINIIPLGAIVSLILACLRGTAGPNRFGPDPHATAGTGHVAGTSLPAAGEPPTPALAPSASPTRRDVIAELERLARLRKDGHLSEAEFEVMKAEALAQARGA